MKCDSPTGTYRGEKPTNHIGKHAAYILGSKVMWTEMYGPATRMMVKL